MGALKARGVLIRGVFVTQLGLSPPSLVLQSKRALGAGETKPPTHERPNVKIMHVFTQKFQ